MSDHNIHAFPSPLKILQPDLWNTFIAQHSAFYYLRSYFKLHCPWPYATYVFLLCKLLNFEYFSVPRKHINVTYIWLNKMHLNTFSFLFWGVLSHLISIKVEIYSQLRSRADAYKALHPHSPHTFRIYVGQPGADLDPLLHFTSGLKHYQLSTTNEFCLKIEGKEFISHLPNLSVTLQFSTPQLSWSQPPDMRDLHA